MVQSAYKVITGKRKGYIFTVDERKEYLQRLHETLIKYENDVFEALSTDLGKSMYETYMSELAMVYEEIKLAVKNLDKWAKPVKVCSSLWSFISKSHIIYEPLGTVLIISPWNYPVLLTLMPLVGAIAAGNFAVLKPSELSNASSQIICTIMQEALPQDMFRCVPGDKETAAELLALRWDHIYFTGSSRVGRIVMKAAANNLTPVTLELGGKSPVIVCDDADIRLSAKRIAWGKVFNAGQICIAPDHVFCHKSILNSFINALKDEFDRMVPDPLNSPNYPKIINSGNFYRIAGYLKDQNIVYGGGFSPLKEKIAPAILLNPPADSPVMKEEIFGPLLPVIEFEELDGVFERIRAGEKPLSAYLFTRDKKIMKNFQNELSFGGGAINDVFMHITNINLPFGGVGMSGMGKGRGYETFKALSNLKSILVRSNLIELPIRFPPYENKKIKNLKYL